MRVLGLLLAASLALGAAFVAPSPPWAVSFVDVAERAGLRHPSVYGGLEQKRFIIETNGAGVAFVDVDNDGWVDALVLNGTRLAEAKREDQSWPHGQAPTSHLYRNDHDGTFTDITERAGLTKTGWASSVCVGDYDNDGWLDLFVTYYGRNVLYHNRGQGRFEDATAQAGFPTTGTRWGSGCSFIDYDRDGKADLFVSNYLAFDLQSALEPGQGANCLWKGIPVNCGPKGLATDTNLLYHNDGDGRFRDVSSASGIGKVKNRYPMTAAAADLDGDGWTDLYVACDSTSAILYRNNQDGTFTDRALESGTGYSEYGNAQAGMGLAVGDFDGDGQIDLLKTHFADDIPALYRNLGRGQFEDVATAVGLGARNRHVEWGAGLPDLDNDGRPDIFYVTGNVYPEIERHFKEYPHRGPRVVFRNVDGTRFEDVTERSGPGAAVAHSSRGAAFGDFDNDGDLDVLVMNMNEPPSLLRNDAPRANGWIEVKLEGTRSNRAGLGATVTVTAAGRKQARAALSQTSYYSHDDLRLHFGLGASAVADVIEVRWPSGLLDRLEHVPGRRVVAIRESGSAGGASAATAGAGPAVGSPSAPDVSGAGGLDLTGTVVRPLSTAAPATVLLFVRADCPIANRYAPEIVRLRDQFSPRGVAFWLVYADPPQDAESIGAHLREYALPGPALRDPEHALVRAAGARVTPEAAVFVPGAMGPKLAYRGRIDDRYQDLGHMRASPTVHDLEDALTAVLAGQAVARSEAPAVGCSIAQNP
ncbi:MAG TPA: FG-GAP-like repeat-containing protein [Vicinamibacteria bacterium]|nr:FG-GAP-like repeat-containing protein [Vicinamibacteria bacterium]